MDIKLKTSIVNKLEWAAAAAAADIDKYKTKLFINNVNKLYIAQFMQ